MNTSTDQPINDGARTWGWVCRVWSAIWTDGDSYEAIRNENARTNGENANLKGQISELERQLRVSSQSNAMFAEKVIELSRLDDEPETDQALVTPAEESPDQRDDTKPHSRVTLGKGFDREALEESARCALQSFAGNATSPTYAALVEKHRARRPGAEVGA